MSLELAVEGVVSEVLAGLAGLSLELGDAAAFGRPDCGGPQLLGGETGIFAEAEGELVDVLDE